MNPRLIIVCTGAALLVVSFAISDKAVDFQLYDTYVITSWQLVVGYIGAGLCLLGGLSFLTARKRSRQT